MTTLTVLPPAGAEPTLARPVPRLTAGVIDRLDALLLVVPAPPRPRDLASLPHGALLLRRFRAQERRAGQAFTARLPNDAQTLVVVGITSKGASRFEQLELAGRMLHELPLDACGTLGAAASGLEPGEEADLVAACLSAAMAAHFRLPRAHGKRDSGPRRRTPGRPRP